MIQSNRADRQRDASSACTTTSTRPTTGTSPSVGLRIVLHDLRDGSPTDGATLALDLGARDDGDHDHRGVFIPPGVAHGFASLTDMTITYLVDGYYNPADELGVAWDDPAIDADWGSRPGALQADQTNPSRHEIEPALRPPAASHVTGRQLFVTGGAGFIGSNYTPCWVLEHSDDAVTVFDVPLRGNLDNLRGLDDDPRFRS